MQSPTSPSLDEHPKQQGDKTRNHTEISNGGGRGVGGRRRGRSISTFQFDKLKWKNFSRGALFVSSIDVELLSSLTVLSKAIVEVIVPGPCDVDNHWPVVEHANDMLFGASFKVFFVDDYNIVGARPAREN